MLIRWACQQMRLLIDAVVFRYCQLHDMTNADWIVARNMMETRQFYPSSILLRIDTYNTKQYPESLADK